MAIGIQRAAVTAGITDIGPARPMQEPAGLVLDTTEENFLRVTGRATGDDLNITMDGIATAGAISTAIATMIATSGLASCCGRPGNHAERRGPGILCFGDFRRFTDSDKCFAVSSRFIFCSVFH